MSACARSTSTTTTRCSQACPPNPGPHPATPPELASLNPLSMLYGRLFMMHVMRGPSGVTSAEREMIATVTSLASNCRY